MKTNTGERSGLTRRGALKLGLGTVVAVAAFGSGARIVMAQEGQILKAIHPAFNQDWSPLRGGGVPFRWNSFWNASAMYFNDKGIVKLKLGIAKGKKLADKRETSAKRDWERQKSRIMKQNNQG